MRLLVDTHIAVWAVAEPHRLSQRAQLCLNECATAYVSSISLVEIAFKHRKNPEMMTMSATEALDAFLKAGFERVSYTSEHSLGLDSLPLFHKDPFDRMLVAQALTEPLRLLTADATLARYSDTVILV